ncbi:MAG TPA: FMN-binding protein [Euryarchaeota archaeon]|nr:electron transport complex protein RnfG [archaeon BMS3Abin16]GBE56045.1 electron transport complex protein RnfG [archaeon BMS3Bbin16]HDH28707.1 FMN-binding protein [Euryarchaeota archaeon]
MSKNAAGPIGIIGRLTVTLLISVTILTVYSNAVGNMGVSGGDPVAKAFSKIFPAASEFKPVFDEKNNTLYYEAYTAEGALIGYAFSQTGRGMWGDIQIAGGLDLNFKLIGLSVIKQSETPGLGARIVEPQFLDQFKGLAAEDVKLEKYGGKVDAISGASISSKAVTEIIRSEMKRITPMLEAKG